MNINSRIRTRTKTMTISEFVQKLHELAYVNPLPSCEEDIKGEIFLTDKAFAKLLAADNLVENIFLPQLNANNKDVVGILYNSRGNKYSVRTNAMQRSIHRDYEGLGDGDMELRLFA